MGMTPKAAAYLRRSGMPEGHIDALARGEVLGATGDVLAGWLKHAFKDGRRSIRSLLRLAEDRLVQQQADLEAARDKIGDLTSDIRALEGFRDNAAEYQAIVADCLLWFDGFAAAHSPRESWERPHLPDRERIRGLNAALQRLVPDSRAETEVPF